MRYEVFDLWIDPQIGDHYPIRAQYKTKYKTKDTAEGKLTVADFDELKELAAKLTAGADETSLASTDAPSRASSRAAADPDRASPSTATRAPRTATGRALTGS